MTFDPLALPPQLTAEFPGIGGRIKSTPEDFEVEEIPAYDFSGTGEFLYLRIEKRGMGAEYFQRQVAQRLGIGSREVGMAGLKDRQAVTRQWISVPKEVESRLNQLDGDGIRLLKTACHGNKLKPGHLLGNRFTVRIREVSPSAMECVNPILEKIQQQGFPNFYGVQRFGREGETVRQGFALLDAGNQPVPRLNPFLRKLALSAAQSSLFNYYLGTRLQDGLLRTVLLGDVMAKWPRGGMFVVEDVQREQARFEIRETIPAGPIFGKKTFKAAGPAAERELACLAEAGLTPASFSGFGKLMQGTRRMNLVYVDDLRAVQDEQGICLYFTLPAGSYATVLLGEIMKTDLEE